MDAFELERLVSTAGEKGTLYYEFLRVPSLSMGVYQLKVGAQDPQTPHTEDEAYFVVRGHGFLHVGSEDRRVGPGFVVFVRAGVEHRFHDITDDMVILVCFAPAEGSIRDA